MKLSDLTSSDLSRLSKLIAERDALTARLSLVESQINSFSTGQPAAPAKRGRPAGSKNLIRSLSVGRRGPKKGDKPGKLKELIIKALQNAGKDGLSISELSDKLKVKKNNLFSWFYTTGAKIKQISKVGAGRYAYGA